MNFYHMLYGMPARQPELKPGAARLRGLPLLWTTLRREWWTLIKANILFWVCCLPVVTVPAALKALTRVSVTLLRDEPCDLWYDWWKGFRSDFIRTTAAGGLVALLLCAGGAGVRFYGSAMGENGMFAAPALLLLAAMAVLTMSLFSLFPLLEFSQLKLGEALRSALLLTLVRLRQNLAVLLVLGGMTAAYLLTYPYSTFVLGGIAFSLFWLIACFAAWPGLEKYVFKLPAEDAVPAADQ